MFLLIALASFILPIARVAKAWVANDSSMSKVCCQKMHDNVI
jgi:hypothetical protein